MVIRKNVYRLEAHGKKSQHCVNTATAMNKFLNRASDFFEITFVWMSVCVYSLVIEPK